MGYNYKINKVLKEVEVKEFINITCDTCKEIIPDTRDWDYHPRPAGKERKVFIEDPYGYVKDIELILCEKCCKLYIKEMSNKFSMGVKND